MALPRGFVPQKSSLSRLIDLLHFLWLSTPGVVGGDVDREVTDKVLSQGSACLLSPLPLTLTEVQEQGKDRQDLVYQRSRQAY